MGWMQKIAFLLFVFQVYHKWIVIGCSIKPIRPIRPVKSVRPVGSGPKLSLSSGTTRNSSTGKQVSTPEKWLGLPGVSHIPVTADIAFLIDGSHYVGRRNFHHQKAFIKSIARRFTIAKHHSHIGVATYGSRPQLRIGFNECGSFGLLLKVLDCIRYPNQNGRRVDLGMNAALRYFFKKRYKYTFVQNILVVIVNGRQTGRSCHIMRRLRWQFAKLGVKVYVVGVGRIDYRYFRPITYKNRHVYSVRSYRSLVTRAGQIARAILSEMRIERERHRDLLSEIDKFHPHHSNSSEENWEQDINTSTEPPNETEPEVETTLLKLHEASWGQHISSTDEDREQNKNPIVTDVHERINPTDSEDGANIKQPQECENFRCNSAEEDMGQNINANMVQVPEQNSANVIIPPENDGSQSNRSEEYMELNMSNTTLSDVPEQGSGAQSVEEVYPATPHKIVGHGAKMTVEDSRPKRNGAMKDFAERPNETKLGDVNHLARIHELDGHR